MKDIEQILYISGRRDLHKHPEKIWERLTLQYYAKVLRKVCLCCCPLILILILGCSGAPNPDFMTAQLKDLELGAGMAQIEKKIKGAGDYTVSKINKYGRKKLTWKPVVSRNYKKIEFEFTEKDRLYLVRFYLADELRYRSRGLKDDFFKHFNISYENPSHYRLKGKDIGLYVPKEEKPHIFIFVDANKGEKWFEVFDRYVSAQDRTGGSVLERMLKKMRESEDNVKTGASGDEGKGSAKDREESAVLDDEKARRTLKEMQATGGEEPDK